MSKEFPLDDKEQLNLLNKMKATAPTEEMIQELTKQIKELEKKIAKNE